MGGNDARGRWWEDELLRSATAIPEAVSKSAVVLIGENVAK